MMMSIDFIVLQISTHTHHNKLKICCVINHQLIHLAIIHRTYVLAAGIENFGHKSLYIILSLQ